MNKVDLNSDLGEISDISFVKKDIQIIKYISSVNIACGWHAGSPEVMREIVNVALANGCAIGAHPGFDDPSNFGRIAIPITPSKAKSIVKNQVLALLEYTDKLQHVKVHGALYNMAATDYSLAYAIAEGIMEIDPEIIFLVLSGSQMETAANDLGMRYASEVFADREYMPDGTLVPRSRQDAFILDKDQAIRRVIRMAKDSRVQSINGEDISIKADSICIHGDNPKALSFVKEIKKALEAEGIMIAKLAEVLDNA
jgi:UPF0271 protein